MDQGVRQARGSGPGPGAGRHKPQLMRQAGWERLRPRGRWRAVCAAPRRQDRVPLVCLAASPDAVGPCPAVGPYGLSAGRIGVACESVQRPGPAGPAGGLSASAGPRRWPAATAQIARQSGLVHKGVSNSFACLARSETPCVWHEAACTRTLNSFVCRYHPGALRAVCRYKLSARPRRSGSGPPTRRSTSCAARCPAPLPRPAAPPRCPAPLPRSRRHSSRLYSPLLSRSGRARLCSCTQACAGQHAGRARPRVLPGPARQAERSAGSARQHARSGRVAAIEPDSAAWRLAHLTPASSSPSPTKGLFPTSEAMLSAARRRVRSLPAQFSHAVSHAVPCRSRGSASHMVLGLRVWGGAGDGRWRWRRSGCGRGGASWRRCRR